MTELTTNHFLFLSAALFVIGLMGVLVRRNLIIMFMCVELMMNAVNLSLVAFARETSTMYGEGFVIFTIAVAAAEAAVGLAIILALSRRRLHRRRRRVPRPARLTNGEPLRRDVAPEFVTDAGVSVLPAKGLAPASRPHGDEIV